MAYNSDCLENKEHFLLGKAYLWLIELCLR